MIGLVMVNRITEKKKLFLFSQVTCIWCSAARVQQKVQVGMCAHQRLRSDCTSVQSDLSLRVAKSQMFLQAEK